MVKKHHKTLTQDDVPTGYNHIIRVKSNKNIRKHMEISRLLRKITRDTCRSYEK